MQLKFEGNTHSIDSNTLVSVLVHYQTIANTANLVYSGGEKEIRINVNAIEKGSFVIDLSVVQNVVMKLFAKDCVEYVAGLTTIIGGVYGLYKCFKGKPIRTDADKNMAKEQVKANIDVAINVYNQPLVREAISKSMERVEEDPSIDGFSVIDENRETSFSRKEFKEYIYDGFDTENTVPEDRTIEEEAVLTIVGLNFEQGSRWQFLYNGFKISMNVKDDALTRKINEGARFGKGDSIRVIMRRTQSFNKDYKAYENKSYKIVEFKEHIIPQKPLDLFN